MSKWFRAYSETLNDPKVQLLPLAAFKAWHNALYLAATIDSKDGNIGNIETVSYAFRETKEAVSSAFHPLLDAGLIVTVDETFHIVSWRKRQYKSDTSTSRVRKYRAKTKRSRNVTETAPDTDTDTEQIQKKKVPKKGSRLSDDWLPDKNQIQIATDRGLSSAQVNDEITKFKNYWISKTGKDAVKLDWQRTFNNWILNWKGSSNVTTSNGRENFRDELDQTMRNLSGML